MRRSARRMCTAAAVLLMQAGAALAQPGPAEKLRDPDRVLVIAHRGCVGEAPEVSVASIHACAGTGVDGIELDIRKTADGVLVSIHDDTIDRTTNGTGRVKEMSLAQLQAFRLRRGNGGRYAVVTDEPVPTLESMLLAARAHGFIVHLDIKDATHGEVAEVMERLGMAGQGTAWLTGRPDSPDQPDPALGRVLALVPRIQDCPEGSPPTCVANSSADLMAFERFNPAGYFLWYRTSPEALQAFMRAPRPAGTRVTSETLWEIDNLPTPARHLQYRRLREQGVTLFLTDKPADMARYFNRIGAQ